MHRRIVGSLTASSALDGFSPINIAQGLESSQRRLNAYRYVRQSENMASDFTAAPFLFLPHHLRSNQRGHRMIRATLPLVARPCHFLAGPSRMITPGWCKICHPAPMLRLHGTRDSLLVALTAHWADQQLQLPSGINPTAARSTASCYGPWDSPAASPQTSAGSRSLA